MKPFEPCEYPTLGIEQEFHLIAPDTAELVPFCDEVLANLPEEQRARACHELFYSVLEIRGTVCRTPAEVVEHVHEDRLAMDEACRKVGCRVVASGTHPFSNWADQKIVQSEHYVWVEEEAGFIVQRLLAFGLHVHVGVDSGEAAIYIMHEITRWLYPMLALSANSPFREGRSSGLASVRAHLFDAMPRTNLAPDFQNYDELVAFSNKLMDTGDIWAAGHLWWSVRPQPPLGTIEIRILDMPTDVRRIGALAAIVQALVATFQDRYHAGVPRTEIRREYLEQNHWQAMRHGLEGKLAEPATGEVVPMREQISRMLDFAAPKSEELGSVDEFRFARETMLNATESQWQLQRWEELDRDLAKLELEIAERTLANSDTL